MTIRFNLTAGDLANVTLQADPGPPAETALAARLVQRRDLPLRLRPWQRHAAQLDMRARALLDLVPPHGLNCAFVAPNAGTIAEGLRKMHDTRPPTLPMSSLMSS